MNQPSKKTNIKPKSISRPKAITYDDDIYKKKVNPSENKANPNSKYKTRGNIDRIHLDTDDNSEHSVNNENNENKDTKEDDLDDDKESVRSSSIRYKKDEDIVKFIMDNDLKSP